MENLGIRVEREAVEFSPWTSTVATEVMWNLTEDTVAVKVKCTNNSLFRVHPVFAVVPPGAGLRLRLLRRPGPPSMDKAMLLTQPCHPAASLKDVANLFKLPNRGTATVVILVAKMECKVPIVFLCGGPGAGKGTQGALLQARLGLSHISSGELLRAEVASGSALGAQLERTMSVGGLVHMRVVLGLVIKALDEASKSGAWAILMDGHPRTEAEREQWEAVVGPPSLVLHLHAPDHVLAARLAARAASSGRSDDAKESVILRRIGTFHAHTDPLIHRYRRAGLVATLDASASISTVYERILTIFRSLTYPGQ